MAYPENAGNRRTAISRLFRIRIGNSGYCLRWPEFDLAHVGGCQHQGETAKETCSGDSQTPLIQRQNPIHSRSETLVVRDHDKAGSPLGIEL